MKMLCRSNKTVIGLFMASLAWATQAVDPAGLLPFGWQLLTQAVGDLNKDGNDDLALVIAPEDEANRNQNENPRRRLVVYFQLADGRYSRVIESTSAILCYHCGGVFGDPFESLDIERGAVVLRHYGGSRDRWGLTHRFRWQDGGWYLIGRTRHFHDTLSPREEIIDENLSTGKTIIKRTNEAGINSRESQEAGRQALINLIDFDIETDGQ